MKTLNDLFQNTIRDMYSSEKLLLKAMPDLLNAAQSPRLKDAIRTHIGQTEEHVRRIEQIARSLNFDPGGVTCQGTVGLVKETQEHLQEFGGSPAGDAAIIACAQKAEHYEIGNYGTTLEWAEMLGYEEVATILEQTLGEEEETDDLLTEIAESEANQTAIAGGSGGATLM
jgi:ferritin-like metal-binding protein YciE